jgi:hypothetical protein
VISIGIVLICLAVIGSLSPKEQPEVENYKPTRRQRREWAKSRLVLATRNRKTR